MLAVGIGVGDVIMTQKIQTTTDGFTFVDKNVNAYLSKVANEDKIAINNDGAITTGSSAEYFKIQFDFVID